MASRETHFVEITPEVLLKAYACGIFPMAESADDPALYWIEPEKRGIIPLNTFHVASRLARTVRSGRYSIAVNRDFDGVLDRCAEAAPGRARPSLHAPLHTRGLAPPPHGPPGPLQHRSQPRLRRRARRLRRARARPRPHLDQRPHPHAPLPA